ASFSWPAAPASTSSRRRRPGAWSACASSWVRRQKEGRGHEKSRAGRGRGFTVRRAQGELPRPHLGGGQGVLRLGARGEADGRRGARGRLRHAGANGVPVAHLVARRRG